MDCKNDELVCTIVLINFMTVPLAMAQAAVLDEVMVTAEKHEQSLQDTPNAV